MTKRQDWIMLERLGDIVLNNVKGDILEIGIGFSTPILSRLADDFDRKLYCLEKSQSRCEWAKIFGATIYQGKSLSNIEKLSDVSIALGLIDGKHKADTVRKEINFFIDRLAVGGVIFLHDTIRISSPLLRPDMDLNDKKMMGDVYKIRKELELFNNIQVFTWPYTAMDCGLTMVMKLNA